MKKQTTYEEDYKYIMERDKLKNNEYVCTKCEGRFEKLGLLVVHKCCKKRKVKRNLPAMCRMQQ